MSELNPDYTFVLYESTTGTPICELPLTDVSYTQALNGQEQMTAKIDPNVDECTNDNMQTLSREIGIWRNEFPVFVGPITQLSPAKDEQGNVSCDLGCSSVWWYMQHRDNELDLSYTSEDVALIIWDVLSVAQGLLPGGDIRLEQSPFYPGPIGWVETLNKTNWTKLSSISPDPVSSIIEQLGVQYPGYDFRIELDVDATVPQGIRRFFNIYSPFRSVVSDYRIDDDSPVMSFKVNEDGTDVHARTTQLGAKGLVKREDSAELTAGDIPMIVGIDSEPGVGKLSTLTNYADAALLLHHWPMRTFELSYRPSETIPFGGGLGAVTAITPGDTIPVDISIGNLRYTKNLRTAAIQVDLAGGEEKITPLFNNPADGS